MSCELNTQVCTRTHACTHTNKVGHTFIREIIQVFDHERAATIREFCTFPPFQRMTLEIILLLKECKIYVTSISNENSNVYMVSIHRLKRSTIYKIATWSVHDQSRDQCMISHVISAWSATWSVHDQLRDQCMISHVTSTW